MTRFFFLFWFAFSLVNAVRPETLAPVRQVQQQAYVIVQEPPVAGLLPRCSTVEIPLFDATRNQHRNAPGVLDGYVVWYLPPRAPEYHITLTDISGFFILPADRFTVTGQLPGC